MIPTALTSAAIIDLIQTAFADVKLGDGISLHQAIALDNYRSQAELQIVWQWEEYIKN